MKTRNMESNRGNAVPNQFIITDDFGAEYLTDTHIKWSHNGKSGKEGTFTDNAKYIVRIDGNIEKDATLTIRDEDLDYRPP